MRNMPPVVRHVMAAVVNVFALLVSWFLVLVAFGVAETLAGPTRWFGCRRRRRRGAGVRSLAGGCGDHGRVGCSTPTEAPHRKACRRFPPTGGRRFYPNHHASSDRLNTPIEQVLIVLGEADDALRFTQDANPAALSG